MRKLVRFFLKKLTTRIIQNRYQKYSKTDHLVNFHGLSIQVNSGIFQPNFFFSTNVLVEYFKRRSIHHKAILELGCGTGAFSCWASSQGAFVTASDINPKAVENAKLNASLNNRVINTVESDLFENLDEIKFDYVVVNPPYYPKTPTNDAERAWFCGEEFEYFQRFFSQLAALNNWEKAVMVLSEDCNIRMVTSLAKKNDLNFRQDWQTTTWLERNYIFMISKKLLS